MTTATYTRDELANMTVADLRDLAESNAVELNGAKKKDEIVDELAAAFAATESDDDSDSEESSDEASTTSVDDEAKRRQADCQEITRRLIDAINESESDEASIENGILTVNDEVIRWSVKWNYNAAKEYGCYVATVGDSNGKTTKRSKEVESLSIRDLAAGAVDCATISGLRRKRAEKASEEMKRRNERIAEIAKKYEGTPVRLVATKNGVSVQFKREVADDNVEAFCGELLAALSDAARHACDER